MKVTVSNISGHLRAEGQPGGFHSETQIVSALWATLIIKEEKEMPQHTTDLHQSAKARPGSLNIYVNEEHADRMTTTKPLHKIC